MLIEQSFWLFALAFFSYLGATILYVAGFVGIRRGAGVAVAAAGAGPGAGVVTVTGSDWYLRASRWAYNIITVGTIAHGSAIVFRGLASGQWPMSNMFEFLSLFGFMMMLAFQVLHWIFHLPSVGALIAPLGVIALAYASVFPKEIKPLVPALQSKWLVLHVTTVSLGEGFFVVAFVAAILYLLRTWREDLPRLDSGALEALFWSAVILIAFIGMAYGIRSGGGGWSLPTPAGGTVTYHLPPVIGSSAAAVGSQGRLFGIIPMPLLHGASASTAKNLNTLVWALIAGTALYYAIRGILGRPIHAALAGLTRKMDPELLDEVSYRSIAIGYPIFTLGGLVFAMIWAKEAWGRYWFWDPKETWALISWLVYSGYLHARISAGWAGRRSAWLNVLGFGVILFTLVGVNLLIVGLHSYVGGDV